MLFHVWVAFWSDATASLVFKIRLAFSLLTLAAENAKEFVKQAIDGRFPALKPLLKSLKDI